VSASDTQIREARERPLSAAQRKGIKPSGKEKSLAGDFLLLCIPPGCANRPFTRFTILAKPKSCVRPERSEEVLLG